MRRYFGVKFRVIMSLHLLPHGKIEAAFNRLHAQGTDLTFPIERRQRSSLIQLLDYVDTTFIHNTNWSPKDCSSYMQKVIFVSPILYVLSHCANYIMYPSSLYSGQNNKRRGRMEDTLVQVCRTKDMRYHIKFVHSF